jgi:hypothetical protein
MEHYNLLNLVRNLNKLTKWETACLLLTSSGGRAEMLLSDRSSSTREVKFFSPWKKSKGEQEQHIKYWTGEIDRYAISKIDHWSIR